MIRHGFDPSLLEIEIAESVLMRNMEESLGIIKSLRGLGVGVVVDDFGTGYSSLHYLRRLPVNGVKIDPSLITEITTSANDRIVVKAIIELARRLDLSVTAEGIETLEQIAVVREMGCTEYLGNVFLPAMPAAELERHLLSGANVSTLSSRRQPAA